MALPPVTIPKRDLRRVVSPYDGAIDLKSTTAAWDALPDDKKQEGESPFALYFQGKDLDTGKLTFKDGVDATWFTMRSLTAPERQALTSLQAQKLPNPETDRRGYEAAVHAFYRLWVSFCLVSVENLEGWEENAVRVPLENMPRIKVWSDESVATIDNGTLRFLGSVGIDMTNLSDSKKKGCGSQAQSSTGTTQGPGQKTVNGQGDKSG